MSPSVESDAFSPLASEPSIIVSPDVVDMPAHPDDKVIDYITSKPDFSHDLLEVQRFFFGQVFKSRGKTKRMYHRTARQLRMVRKIIESRYEGVFVSRLGSDGVKRFVFKKQRTPTK